MAARVLYMHEGNARSLEDLSMGAVASYLKARFPETHVEAMETVVSKMVTCEHQQLNALHVFKPNIVVAKAFGGMLAMDLIRKGYWAGPTLLLAPAAVPGIDDLALAPGLAITIAYGANDTRGLSAPGVCKAIADANPTCSITLAEVDDTYELESLLADGGGVSLAQMVEQVLAGAPSVSDPAGYLPKETEYWAAAANSKPGKIGQKTRKACCIVA